MTSTPNYYSSCQRGMVNGKIQYAQHNLALGQYMSRKPRAIDDPSRDQQVIQGAVDGAPAVHLHQSVAQMVYQNIVNFSVLFEECIVRDRIVVVG